MGFKCGIVGLPNVGKSTLFNALTQAGIDAANYPFCTIEPNTGVVGVPDPRLHNVAKLAKSKQIIPAKMEFVDIAGLVSGASQGEGLGNQFLAHIRETNAIAHVVRCFEDDDITHVSGKVSPIDDIETINIELILADLDTINNALTRCQKETKSKPKEAALKLASLNKIKSGLEQETPARSQNLDDNDLAVISPYNLLTLKPTLYIANVDEGDQSNNPLLKQVNDYAQNENSVVVSICASIEAEIAQLDSEEQQEFLKDMGLDEPGLDRVIRAGYKLLGLETYFTAGPKEARAWTIHHGYSAPEAAGVIHTDFQRGFIRAEVIAYNDYITHQGEIGAKEAGRWRQEGKEYIVADGDVILFRFNV